MRRRHSPCDVKCASSSRPPARRATSARSSPSPCRPRPGRQGARSPARASRRARESAGFDVWPFPRPTRRPRRASSPGWAATSARSRRTAVVVSELFAGLYAEAALPRVVEACATCGPTWSSPGAEFAGSLAAERAGSRTCASASRAELEAQFIEDRRRVAPRRARPRPGRTQRAAPRRPTSRSPRPRSTTPRPCRTRDASARRSPRRRRCPTGGSGAGEPLVYLTLGSVAGAMGFFPGVYRAAIDALAPSASACS